MKILHSNESITTATHSIICSESPSMYHTDSRRPNCKRRFQEKSHFEQTSLQNIQLARLCEMSECLQIYTDDVSNALVSILEAGTGHFPIIWR